MDGLGGSNGLDDPAPKGETRSFVGEACLGGVPNGEADCVGGFENFFGVDPKPFGDPDDFGIDEPNAPGGPFCGGTPKEGADCTWGDDCLKPVPTGEVASLNGDPLAFFGERSKLFGEIPVFGTDVPDALGDPAFEATLSKGEVLGELYGACFPEGLKGGIDFLAGEALCLDMDVNLFLLRICVDRQ